MLEASSVSGSPALGVGRHPPRELVGRAVGYYLAPGQDEGNAYLRLREVLTKLGWEDEARETYGTGVGQAERFGHSGMAEDLRRAGPTRRVGLGGAVRG
jgi:hypothetical protein